MMPKALSTKKNKLDSIQIHISPVQETIWKDKPYTGGNVCKIILNTILNIKTQKVEDRQPA